MVAEPTAARTRAWICEPHRGKRGYLHEMPTVSDLGGVRECLGRSKGVDNAFPRQVLRQRPARRLTAREWRHRNLVGCGHLRRGLGLRGVLFQILELQLELVQQCAALRGLSELLVPQLPDREFELLDQQCLRLGIRLGGQAGRSLGAQHRSAWSRLPNPSCQRILISLPLLPRNT